MVFTKGLLCHQNRFGCIYNRNVSSFYYYYYNSYYQELPTKLTLNQSIVQQLMSEGNILSLFLKASPMGLKASTT